MLNARRPFTATARRRWWWITLKVMSLRVICDFLKKTLRLMPDPSKFLVVPTGVGKKPESSKRVERAICEKL